MSEDTVGLVGKTIAEKYLVEKVVGEGGFAVVYRAAHLLWKRPVAVKVFKALADLSPALREELTQDFIREGALLAELSEKSASICQARDVGVVTLADGSSVPYMVLEWLEGESLEAAVVREQAEGMAPRTLAQTMRLLDPIAEALALAHARGIAHRDVKPANIFLLGAARDERCPVKLLDFGIAKVVQDIQKTGGSFNQTGQKVRSFTPAYAAPEQFSRAHGATGPWSDVFALALVAVELLTGKPPLEGDDFLQLGFAASDPVVRPTPRTRGAVTSDEVEAVFRRALAVNLTDRYASADAFWQELVAAAGAIAPLPSATRPMAASAPAASVRLDALAATAVAQDSERLSVTAAATLVPTQSPPRKARAWIVAALTLPVVALVAFAIVPRKATTVPAPAMSALASPPMPAPSASSAPPSGMVCPDGMVAIPGGTFFMGSDDGNVPEKPAHKVTLLPYCIDRVEVTTQKYTACSNAGWCKRADTNSVEEGVRSADHDPYDALCNQLDPAGKATHPINCVSWEKADVYCRSNNARLPSEAEWEYAARGSTGQTYPWGDEPPSALRLNACGTECMAWGAANKVDGLRPMYAEDDHWPNTAPVGSFPMGRSPFGVDDLAGNVWEWVQDWYGPYAAGDGVKAEQGPVGPSNGKRKVIRGGAWNGAEASWERPSFRYSKDPADRNYGIGFRCAANATASKADGAASAGVNVTP